METFELLCVTFQEGIFWLVDNDEQGEYHFEVHQWDIIQNRAGNDGWRLKYKFPSQRNWNYSSLFVKDIRAGIENIKDKLNQGFIVVMVSPSCCVEFYKG